MRFPIRSINAAIDKRLNLPIEKLYNAFKFQ